MVLKEWDAGRDSTCALMVAIAAVVVVTLVVVQWCNGAMAASAVPQADSVTASAVAAAVEAVLAAAKVHTSAA